MCLYSQRMQVRAKNSLAARLAALGVPFCARVLACALLIAACGAAHAQPAPGEHGYADEERDWGIAPTNRLRQPPYHGPTPLQIPGAQLVNTRELQAMLAGPGSPILVDVLSGEGHLTLAGAAWISGAGRGANFLDPVQSMLAPLLAQLAGGDKTRAMVFFCASAQCWLSYNAALRAVVAGYSRVYWYRGGIDAWIAAGLPTARTVAKR